MAEQLARDELAQAYRIAARLGLSEMGAGLINARLNRTQHTCFYLLFYTILLLLR